MTATVASHFDTVLIGNADQGVDLPISGIVPHLGNQFIGAAHGKDDTKYNIINQGEIFDVKRLLCWCLSYEYYSIKGAIRVGIKDLLLPFE